MWSAIICVINESDSFVCCTTPLVFLSSSLTVTYLLTFSSSVTPWSGWRHLGGRRSVVVVMQLSQLWLYNSTLSWGHRRSCFHCTAISGSCQCPFILPFYVGWVQLCEELPGYLSLCPSVGLTPLQCCVNTNLSLTDLMHQSAVPMQGRPSSVLLLTYLFVCFFVFFLPVQL